MLSRRDTIRGSLLALGLCLARFFPPIPEKSKLSNPFEGLNVGDFVEVSSNSLFWNLLCRVSRIDDDEITLAHPDSGLLQDLLPPDHAIHQATLKIKRKLDLKDWQA